MKNHSGFRLSHSRDLFPSRRRGLLHCIALGLSMERYLLAFVRFSGHDLRDEDLHRRYVDAIMESHGRLWRELFESTDSK